MPAWLRLNPDITRCCQSQGSLGLDFVGTDVWPRLSCNVIAVQIQPQTFTLEVVHHFPTDISILYLHDILSGRHYFQILLHVCD